MPDKKGIIIGFQSRFESLIIKGIKKCTIRPNNRFSIGCKVQLYKGSPRNKNSYKIADATITNLSNITLDFNRKSILVGSKLIFKENELNEFAIKDGFSSFEEMKILFKSMYKKTVFENFTLIEFEVAQETIFKSETLF